MTARRYPRAQRRPAAALALGIPAVAATLVLADLLRVLWFTVVLWAVLLGIPALAITIVSLLGQRQPAGTWHPEGSAAERVTRGGAR